MVRLLYLSPCFDHTSDKLSEVFFFQISKILIELSDSKDSDFNKIARLYDLLAFCIFGFSQKKAQSHFLHDIPVNSTILIIGGGSGWILKKIFEICDPRHITYVEASSKMLSMSKRGIKSSSKKVDFLLGSETMIPDSQTYDVIITSFFLDLFSQRRVNAIIGILDVKLKSGGLWLQTDFVEDKNKTNRLKHFLINGMYAFFRLVCSIEGDRLLDYDSIFKTFNFAERKMKYFYFDMIKSSIYQKQ